MTISTTFMNVIYTNRIASMVFNWSMAYTCLWQYLLQPLNWKNTKSVSCWAVWYHCTSFIKVICNNFQYLIHKVYTLCIILKCYALFHQKFYHLLFFLLITTDNCPLSWILKLVLDVDNSVDKYGNVLHVEYELFSL